ncbi:MAG: thiamine pyrophosphate-dependent dehydrogenase E1 component subunit alpha [Vicinamibacterales bacterium]|nr:thiamine pyrophosphate-dependent dehydrogenase E1 component subunit alpha [Vicinamibacterales bacterium]
MPATTATRPSDELSRDQRLELFYFARLTRDIEERLALLYRQNKVVGGLYRSLGQEGESVASAYALAENDAVAALIRNLGSVIVQGIRPRAIFAQYMAKGTSPTRGRDLNLHFSHIPNGDDGPIVIGPISTLGDLVPVMAGVGLGARMRRRRLVAMTYIGDGGTSTGAFHEGMNFAAVQKLPLVVIAEDNKYAYSTPVSQQMAIPRIDQRAEAYGIPHEMVDGNDMLAVYDASKRAVDLARQGAGPSLIGVDTMRMRGHAEHDDMRYVSKPLLDAWEARDPITRYRAHLIETEVATETDLVEIEAMSRQYAEDEAGLAEADPGPDPATVADGVVAGGHFQPSVEIVRSPFRVKRGASRHTQPTVVRP